MKEVPCHGRAAAADDTRIFMAVNPDDKSLALFCDFENIALGVRDAKYKKFNIQHVLERLLVKGSIVVKKAYCDWDRYKEFKAPMHEAAFELIEIPHVRMSGKNSADIRMVVDALDLCYTKSHVDTFVVISGDSDFSPLVSKLRENAKTVIGVGVKNSTSDLLINSCDEFIYYDDLVRELERKDKDRDSSSRRGGRKRSGSRGGRGRRSESENATEQVVSEAVTPADTATKTVTDTAPDASTTNNSAESRERAAPAARAERAGSSSSERPARSERAERAAPARNERAAAADASRPASRPPVGDGAVLDEDDDEVGVVVFAVADDQAGEVEFDAGPGSAGASRSNGVADSASDGASDGDGSADDADDADDDGVDDELQQEGIDLMIETATALSTERGGKDRLWGSMIKQALKRRRPGFNESYYGFDSFSKMLEEAEAQGLLTLEPDDRSGGYIIRDVNG